MGSFSAVLAAVAHDHLRLLFVLVCLACLVAAGVAAWRGFVVPALTLLGCAVVAAVLFL